MTICDRGSHSALAKELVELAHVSAKQLYEAQMSAKLIGIAGCVVGRPNKLGHDTTAVGSIKHHTVWTPVSNEQYSIDYNL